MWEWKYMRNKIGNFLLEWGRGLVERTHRVFGFPQLRSLNMEMPPTSVLRVVECKYFNGHGIYLNVVRDIFIHFFGWKLLIMEREM